jgi:asparagine synthase (glutamine-hydrolysing)
VELLKSLVAESITEEEFHQYRSRYPEAKLRSAEECHYHRLFLDAYKNPGAVLANVARWAERPL